jgi:hypothetical protein
MGKFLKSEKIKQFEFKAISPDFSKEARVEGIYKFKKRPFCLPLDHAEQNLFKDIRQTAQTYFTDFGIKWHDGKNGKPSNHLCDSQVCCINFLFPFTKEPHILAELLKPFFPNLQEILPIENNQYVVFEWIGLQNYLGEKIRGNGERTRGANFTSADAAVMFRTNNGARQMILIEWKYTESYNGANIKFSANGTDRSEIYKSFYLQNDCPLNRDLLPSFDSLFYEPFYQLMRQQFLAHEMEKAHELDADIVTVLHIAPAKNTDFHKITSPDLIGLGKTAIDVWKRLVKKDNRFISVSTEQFFKILFNNHLPEIQSWNDYIGKRYPWVQEVNQILK